MFGAAVIAAALLVAVALSVIVAWAADDNAKVIENLRAGRTFKIRIQAASVLARLDDRRVVPELGRAATQDRNAGVRVYVLRLLGKGVGRQEDDGAAREAIRRALSDRKADVRAQAQRSLAELERRIASDRAAARPRGGPIAVALRGLGDKSGRASAATKAALRSAILRHLGGTRGVRISEGVVDYAIDASIARLVTAGVGTELELTCAVELVVSRPPRGIVLVASGEATVIESRTARPARRAAMETDAINHAVASAHENLARFFANAQ